ncbi:hypothetical protein PVAG01_10002 [Phlyctema vagabunda]|uniref:Protein ROT1 n=1 Tax=Phlyctema vagabunda TaxID=108571 RepID=A0ABR4P4R2_9HELO
MQFQHGSVVMNDDLSLSLNPFSVDGRQLESKPCSTSKKAVYSRYNQTETFKKWQVYVDPYTKLTRLDLYGFDGTPMHPMFLAYSPPQMLPTITMNPTSAGAQATSKAKVKRDGDEIEYSLPMNANAQHIKRTTTTGSQSPIDLHVVWWAGIGMCVFGGAAYLL